MKTKVSKKRLFIFFIIIFVIVIVIKMSSSFIFYKQEFNTRVYDDLVSTQIYSQYVWASVDEILNKKTVTAEKLGNIKWNYDEILQNLQRLNSKAIRFSPKDEVDVNNLTHLSSQLASMRVKYLEEAQNVILTEEEINTLIHVKEIFKTLEEIIYENLDGVERSFSGVPNVLRDDLWLNIMKAIQLEYDKFR